MSEVQPYQFSKVMIPRFRSAFFAIQTLLIWNLPKAFAIPPHDPSHLEQLSQLSPSQSLPLTISKENQLVYTQYHYESMDDLMNFAGSDPSAGTSSPLPQYHLGQSGPAFGGSESSAELPNSPARGSEPLNPDSFSKPLPRYYWAKVGCIGIIDAARKPEALKLVQPPTFPVFTYPVMARLIFPLEELNVYMEAFQVHVKVFITNTSNLRGTRAKIAKRFGNLNICRTKLIPNLDDKSTSYYVIRLAEMEGKRRPYKSLHDVERLFRSLLKRLIYVHAHFLYSIGKNQDFALERQVEFVKWLYEEIFQPSLGLPILGRVKSLPPGSNKSAFGPVQELIIKHFDKHEGSEDKRYFDTACSIIGLWYKNFDHLNMWNFSDDQFWKIMLNKFDKRKLTLQSYMFQKQSHVVGDLA